MSKYLIVIFTLVCCTFIPLSFAEEVGKQSNQSTTVVATKAPEVGKHVTNTDAESMILSLLMVLVLIVICAFVLKRFNIVQQNTNQLKVVASLSLGAKERVVIVQVAEQQLVLGVTAQQITLIEQLAEPIDTTAESSMPMTGNVLAFLQKANGKPKSAK
ncbi:MAG: flagellar biosynthetic protein FliO [Colwellia sp.]|nr:flagellar biosynthetic protein FliO [Colwellia sp.]MCW8863827.1 flagellar biosynthetic protein FliO [Colwellia sp.]MCW9081109.1 flagellar biosynthetic protein FliO [Colwellia sp.]